MKRLILFFVLMIAQILTIACPVCERAQPRVLRGITHGTGPESDWDLIIISCTAVIVIATLFFSVKWLIKPGEKSINHIKRTVLENN